MKARRLSLPVLLLLTAAALAQSAFAQTRAQKSFDQLKSLTGSWQGKNTQGKTVQVSFRDTAGGSALMSEIQGHGPENMISMFNLDGPNRLLLTHYCGAGNQPRMTGSASPDGNTITFDFLDATNLATPDAGHMQRESSHRGLDLRRPRERNERIFRSPPKRGRAEVIRRSPHFSPPLPEVGTPNPDLKIGKTSP